MCKAHKRNTGYMCNLARKPPEGTNEKKLEEEKNFLKIFFAGNDFLWVIWRRAGAGGIGEVEDEGDPSLRSG